MKKDSFRESRTSFALLEDTIMEESEDSSEEREGDDTLEETRSENDDEAMRGSSQFRPVQSVIITPRQQDGISHTPYKISDPRNANLSSDYEDDRISLKTDFYSPDLYSRDDKVQQTLDTFKKKQVDIQENLKKLEGKKDKDAKPIMETLYEQLRETEQLYQQALAQLKEVQDDLGKKLGKKEERSEPQGSGKSGGGSPSSKQQLSPDEQELTYELKAQLMRNIEMQNQKLKTELTLHEKMNESKMLNQQNRKLHDESTMSRTNTLRLMKMFEKKAKAADEKLKEMQRELHKSQQLTKKYQQLLELEKRKMGGGSGHVTPVSVGDDGESPRVPPPSSYSLLGGNVRVNDIIRKNEVLLEENSNLKREIQRLKQDNATLIKKTKHAMSDKDEIIKRIQTLYAENAKMQSQLAKERSQHRLDNSNMRNRTLSRDLSREKSQHNLLARSLTRQASDWIMLKKQLAQFDEEYKWSQVKTQKEEADQRFGRLPPIYTVVPMTPITEVSAELSTPVDSSSSDLSDLDLELRRDSDIELVGPLNPTGAEERTYQHHAPKNVYMPRKMYPKHEETCVSTEFEELRELDEMLSAECNNESSATCTHAVNLCRSFSLDSRHLLQEYFCTGNINEELLRYEHIQEFLTICNSIKGLSNLKCACASKLLQNLDKEKVFEIFDLADSFEIPEVIEKCADEIVNNIDDVISMSEFLSLRNSQMKALMRSRCCREKLLLRDGLYQWWQCDSSNRGEVYRSLREKIAGKVFEGEGESSESCDSKTYLVMFSITKADDQCFKDAKVLNITSEKGYDVKLKDVTDFTKGYAACCIQTAATEPPYIFISGEGQKSLKFLECDVIMNKWRVCANMKYPRTNHTMRSVKDKVYVLGGKTKDSIVPQIEEFDRKKNSWSLVGNLKWGVSSPLSIVYNEKIYLFGGKDEHGEDVSVIQVFDLMSKSVEVVGYLPIECSGGRTVVIGHSIYILTEQGHCIKFRVEKNESIIQKELPNNRSKFGMYLREKKIYVTGGINASNQSPDFDLVYSVSDNSCEKIARREAKSLNVFGQCFVKIPNNIQFFPLC
ncbi:uncharacterized protein LOC133195708 [Saccostrea echinata]|uniref:uncharacterized protein LOC133195708 n=1 Tax=Saccostrea echinata TaxID=191078 RepID=UPI002A8195E2|nr:uncharacterized protein LOC133195708 [Saccostrea echinata]